MALKDITQPNAGDKDRLAIPNTTIPGALRSRADQSYGAAAEHVRAVSDLLPYYLQAGAQGTTGLAQGQLAASQAVSDPYAKLMTDLFAKYGPQLNALGSQIGAQNAQSEAQTTLDLLGGRGGEAMRALDPEFYATRELTGSRIGDLLRDIDLGSGLSDVERREVEQGLAREGSQRGTLNAPSMSETVSNAMQYGQAGRNRQLQNQSALSQAISAATGFLPASQTSGQQFAVGTGKTAGQNVGQGLFTGVVNTQGNQQNALGGGSEIFQYTGGNQAQRNDLRLQGKIADTGLMGDFLQGSQIFSNVGQGLGGMFRPV